MDEMGPDEGHPTEERLRDFADGKLDEAGAVEVKEHLMSCSGECPSYLDSLPDAWSAALNEASHLLPNHDGNCRRLHGHSYTETHGNFPSAL